MSRQVAMKSGCTWRIASERYQYYEFRTIDRPLSAAEVDALRSISSRAEITSTGFTNDYEWGDLKADPFRLLEKYFDAFVYVANWGVRRFWLRFPRAWIEYEKVRSMLPGDTVWVRRSGQHVIVGFDVNELELDDIDDGSGWMGALVSLRSDLLRGDLQCLYLGWLLCAQIGEFDGEQCEPPVPAGLRQLSAPLQSLIDFLCIDQDLVETAAAISDPLDVGPDREELAAWIRGLLETEKDNLVLTAVSESGERLRNELLHRFHRENQPLARSKNARQLRTVGDLLSAARAREEERAQRFEAERAIEMARKKAEAEAGRARYLDQLAKHEEAIWDQVTAHIQKRQPRAYDHAIRSLIDLRDLAIRQGLETIFKAKIERLRATHSAKTSLLDRLTNAAL
jgi:hypothetical protein